MARPRLGLQTSVEQSTELQQLLAQKAELSARIATLQASTPHQHNRSPIHKSNSQTQRRRDAPRNTTSGERPMARGLNSDHPDRSLQMSSTLSQQSAPCMTRTSSNGSTSLPTRIPFSGTNAPPFLSSSSQDNAVIEAWATNEQPLSSYTFSHQPHQLQRTLPYLRTELTQVPELNNVGEDPATYLSRSGFPSTPSMSVTPSQDLGSAAAGIDQYSNSPYGAATPLTPSDLQSLTTSTTFTSNIMSRQNSLFSEPLHESVQMMKFGSNTSYSTDINSFEYGQSTPRCMNMRRSSEEEQSKLLVGAGGASHDSQLSQSFVATGSLFKPSNMFGEQMIKSDSSGSTSSTSSSISSRSKQRLQDQIAVAARPLMPKNAPDGTALRRGNELLAKREPKDGAHEGLAKQKATYQRPKHDRVFCKQCDDHPDGFRGEHELRRHQDRQHRSMVKKWICKTPTNVSDTLKPTIPLSRCKACQQQKKKYGAYYNAAAHLRRAHFMPRTKGRSKAHKLDNPAQKRGGIGGGNWPTMDELKPWMVEVEEAVSVYSSSASQQEEEISDEDNDHFLEDNISTQAMMNMSNDNASFLSDVQFNAYSSLIGDDPFSMPDLSGMAYHHDISSQQSIDPSMSYSQNTFDSFASFQNDQVAFNSSLSLLRNDQLLGLDSTVDFSFS